MQFCAHITTYPCREPEAGLVYFCQWQESSQTRLIIGKWYYFEDMNYDWILCLVWHLFCLSKSLPLMFPISCLCSCSVGRMLCKYISCLPTPVPRCKGTIRPFKFHEEISISHVNAVKSCNESNHIKRYFNKNRVYPTKVIYGLLQTITSLKVNINSIAIVFLLFQQILRCVKL